MKHKTYKFYGYGSFTSKLKQLALPRWYCLLSCMFWKLWTRINLWLAFSKKSMEKVRKKSARSCSAIKKLRWKISYNSEYLCKQLSFSLVLKAAGFRPSILLKASPCETPVQEFPCEFWKFYQRFFYGTPGEGLPFHSRQ